MCDFMNQFYHHTKLGFAIAAGGGLQYPKEMPTSLATVFPLPEYIALSTIRCIVCPNVREYTG